MEAVKTFLVLVKSLFVAIQLVSSFSTDYAKITYSIKLYAYKDTEYKWTSGLDDRYNFHKEKLISSYILTFTDSTQNCHWDFVYYFRLRLSMEK